jgi:murein DD-endopeptidase MepM/ murein hydrolase activator NlpD
VLAGAFVTAGQVIGKVGHSGLNASQPKHGRHLHFEINEYDGRSVKTWKYAEIRRVLDQARDAGADRDNGHFTRAAK